MVLDNGGSTANKKWNCLDVSITSVEVYQECSRLGKPSASLRRVVANDEFYEGYKSWRIITLLGQLAALHYTIQRLTTLHYYRRVARDK